MYPYGTGEGADRHLALFLYAEGMKTLARGWRRRVAFQLTVVNQKDHSKSVTKGVVNVSDVSSLPLHC